MKFLTKDKQSKILANNITYKENRPTSNRQLRELLLKEQHNFCAYTEKYIQDLHAVCVEHFNAALKYEDDYYNYYAVLSSINNRKKDKAYKDAKFFASLFFQDAAQFNARIQYISGDCLYEEVAINDNEAIDLINFLGFNHEYLYAQRKKHFNRLQNVFKDANYSKADQLEYFKKYPKELSFITALEAELGLDLSEFYA